MNAVAIKSGLVRLGGLGALAGLTVLLTMLFSILGNLTCAVIAGMILGSGRRWQWHAIPLSLVFPLVILSLSYYSKVDLPPRKVYLIALVSTAAFWSVLGMTFSLRFLESKNDPSSSAAAQQISRIDAPPAAPTEFKLTTLQGNWSCEGTSHEGLPQYKSLRIAEGEFVLTTRTSRGREREVARGEVSVDQAGAGNLVFTSTGLEVSKPPASEGVQGPFVADI